MREVIIFGNTQFSRLMGHYLSISNKFHLVGYTVDSEYITSCNEIPFENIENFYSPQNYSILLALGYNKMNMIREKKYHEIKAKGYEIVSYISDNSNVLIPKESIPEGTIVLPGAFIEYNVKLGVSNIINQNCVISHDCIIGDFNFFAASSTLAGDIIVGNRSFFGCNSTYKNGIRIGDMCLVGAGAYVQKNLDSDSVVVPERSILLEKNSLQVNI